MNFMSTDDVSIKEEDGDDDSFLDDDSTDTESLTGSVNVAREDIRLMNVVRAIIILVLLTLAFILSEVAFVVSTLQNESNFRSGYTSAASELVDAFYADISVKLYATQALSTEISSAATGQTWPFVSIPNYQARCQAPMHLARASSIHFSPFVDAPTRTTWETYASDTYEQVIKEDPDIVGSNASTHFNYIATNRNIHEGIYFFKDETAFTLGVSNDHVFPVWQTAPRPSISNSSTGLNAVLYGQTTPARSQALRAMVLRGGSVASTWLYNQTNHSDFCFYKVPETVLSYPLRLGLSQDSLVVGALNLQFQWEQVLANVVKEDSQPLYAVIENLCGGNFTYMVQGVEAVFVGEGDLAALTDLTYTLVESTYTGFASLFDQHGDINVDPATACSYKLMVFPSPEFQATYHNFYPNMFRGIVLSVFFGVILIFIIYDCVVEDRQAKVVNQAQRSDAIVRSLFPDAVRDKLYQNAIRKEEEQKLLHKNGLTEAPKHKLKKMLAEDAEDRANGQGISSEPIADLFPNTSVLFADIAGFTAWSSEREPSQVFILLETIYRAMDRIAKKLGVFKVETIGDCYVAATGVPEAQKDHAEIMCRFARISLIKVNHLTKNLEISLGPGTGDLSMRVGIHSGPVTAGVLRGQKSRFQLFGDTINMAARMESNGLKNKVHLSAETAKLLIDAGQGHRVTERADLVDCKGKGLVQTYWLDLGSSSDSHASSYASSIQSATSNETPIDVNPELDRLDEPHTLKDIWANTGLSAVLGRADIDTKSERLIDWITEVMLSSLKSVVAMHEAREQESSPMQDNVDTNQLVVGSCLDELTMIVPMSDFDKGAFDRMDPSNVDFSSEVRREAREYVMAIATGYRKNPFHNFEHASHVILSATKLMKRIVNPDQVDQNTSFLVKDLHEYSHGIATEPMCQFAVVFSALIHDVGHKGVPNGRLAVEEPEMAALYRDKSLAEQRSIDTAWQLLMLPHFTNLRRCIYQNDEDKQRFRSLLVHSILATDIFCPTLKALQNERWSAAFSPRVSLADAKEHMDRRAIIVLEHIIQASDVSHTMQHWHIYLKWNERLFCEMYFAFLKHRSDKDPSIGWYSGELWFYDNYIIPLAGRLKECGVFGVSSDEYLNYAMQNRREWAIKGKQCVEDFKAKCEREARRKGLLGPESTGCVSLSNKGKGADAETIVKIKDDIPNETKAAFNIVQPITFTAPPGTLGITLDTSNGCAVVFGVEAQSPISKYIVPGDYLVEIDGVLVKNMSTAAISALMKVKHQQQRTFVIERPSTM
ncbi:hypothetical protein MPSEU_000529700 [Mayamaea pseudoterrestris]|nr:hypothetical protein MPSEU_000529700 [Mayamaea pseudoterrestris]